MDDANVKMVGGIGAVPGSFESTEPNAYQIARRSTQVMVFYGASVAKNVALNLSIVVVHYDKVGESLEHGDIAIIQPVVEERNSLGFRLNQSQQEKIISLTGSNARYASRSLVCK